MASRYSEDGSVGWIAKRRASDVGISSGATSPASGGSTGANGQGNAVAKTAGLIVSENRLTPLVVYLCIGLSALTPRLLDKIPTAASFGVLCFIGAKSILQGNEFVERLLLLFVPPSEFPQGRCANCALLIIFADVHTFVHEYVTRTYLDLEQPFNRLSMMIGAACIFSEQVLRASTVADDAWLHPSSALLLCALWGNFWNALHW
jgi:hypothetical protein